VATHLPLRPNLEQYQKQAKDLLRVVTTGDSGVLDRIQLQRFRRDGPVLADAQLTIAREHGIASWTRFKRVQQLVEPFRAALYPGDVEAVRTLLEEAPELAVCEPWPDSPGYKPIEGVSRGCVWHRPQQIQVAGMLVDAGAHCDITTAARAGLVDRVRQMLDEDPALIDAHDQAGRTAMYRAGCVYGRFDEGEAIVDLLLERGARLDFFVACTLSMVEQVERFLRDDPSLATALDPDEMSCLHWSLRPRRSDGDRQAVAITKLLLAAGADVTAINPQEDEMLPIHHCAEWSAFTSQLDLLLEHAADINAKAGNGWTPLDYAMDRGRKGMVKSLEARGGRVSGARDAS
jgi:ankyrin repeat protein